MKEILLFPKDEKDFVEFVDLIGVIVVMFEYLTTNNIKNSFVPQQITETLV